MRKRELLRRERGVAALRGKREEHIIVSVNAKTAYSLNWSFEDCMPTGFCIGHCYGKRRNAEEACRMGSSINSGPVTWPTQQAAYARNTRVLKSLDGEGMECEADRIAAAVAHLGNIRVNGVGDLCVEAVYLVLQLAYRGVHPWGFSKRPDMLTVMAEELDTVGLRVGSIFRPYFLGSIDCCMPTHRIEQLIEATRRLNGEPCLAYATDTKEPLLARYEIDNHWARKYFKVAFGYHTNSKLTVLTHVLECPSTAGKDVHCQDCKQCMGPVYRASQTGQDARRGWKVRMAGARHTLGLEAQP